MTRRAIQPALLMLTTLPTGAAAAPPAIVLLHGRGGPYSINLNKDRTPVSRRCAEKLDCGYLFSLPVISP